MKKSKSLLHQIAAILFLVLAASDLAAQEVWESSSGSYIVSYSSKVTPIPINQIHQWILHLETADGEPVSDANLELQGGMPLHDHGLPTNPLATEYLGEGNYLIEGVRFHMMGDWEITLEISQGNITDTALIYLRI
jgi:hypothetical protein